MKHGFNNDELRRDVCRLASEFPRDWRQDGAARSEMRPNPPQQGDMGSFHLSERKSFATNDFGRYVHMRPSGKKREGGAHLRLGRIAQPLGRIGRRRASRSEKGRARLEF